MSKVIEVKNLTKSFGNFTALDKVNLNVNKGEVHGFIGPNGAGKSTTIRVLLGMLKADSGQVKYLTKMRGNNPLIFIDALPMSQVTQIFGQTSLGVKPLICY